MKTYYRLMYHLLIPVTVLASLVCGEEISIQNITCGFAIAAWGGIGYLIERNREE